MFRKRTLRVFVVDRSGPPSPRIYHLQSPYLTTILMPLPLLKIKVDDPSNNCYWSCRVSGQLHITYEGRCLADFLEERRENISEGKKGELCLKMAELCGGGNIRGIHTICNKYDCGMFMADVEGGTCMNCGKNHGRLYQERRDILKDIEDGAMLRLCEYIE